MQTRRRVGVRVVVRDPVVRDADRLGDDLRLDRLRAVADVGRPANTSTRPSGLTLIHACDGSPFWFMPVGYSIAAIPRPVCFAISEPPGFRAGRRDAPAAARRSRGRASSSGSRPRARARLVGDRLDRRDGRRVGVDDAVRRRVADPVRVLEPNLVRIEAELVRRCGSCASRSRTTTDVTPNPRIAVVGTRFVKTT